MLLLAYNARGCVQIREKKTFNAFLLILRNVNLICEQIFILFRGANNFFDIVET